MNFDATEPDAFDEFDISRARTLRDVVHARLACADREQRSPESAGKTGALEQSA